MALSQWTVFLGLLCNSGSQRQWPWVKPPKTLPPLASVGAPHRVGRPTPVPTPLIFHPPVCGRIMPLARQSLEMIAITSQRLPALVWGLGARQKPRGAVFTSTYTQGKRKLHPLSICYVLSIPAHILSHSFVKAEATSVMFTSFSSA